VVTTVGLSNGFSCGRKYWFQYDCNVLWSKTLDTAWMDIVVVKHIVLAWLQCMNGLSPGQTYFLPHGCNAQCVVVKNTKILVSTGVDLIVVNSIVFNMAAMCCGQKR
jgi:hypothetical protein